MGNQKGPDRKFKAGGVTATIWKNLSKEGEYYTVSIERNFKDKEGKWGTTSSFRVMDLPKVRLVSEKAFEYLSLDKEELKVSEETV